LHNNLTVGTPCLADNRSLFVREADLP
jgi:hypothetical protein